MIRFGAYLLLLFASCGPWSAHAAEVVGLYEAMAPVASQAAADREAALRAALAEVLVKVSGRSDVMLRPGLAAALRDPGKWVQQYRYQQDTTTPRAAGVKQLLWCSFDANAVNELLRQQGVTVWGRTRPATLLWLAIQNNNRRDLLQAGTPEQQEVEAAASRRGLALILPLMDLQDRASITSSDVWGDFQDTINNASLRYRAESILSGRLEQVADGDWVGRWSLSDGGRVNGWDVRGSFAVVLDAGMIGAMDLLSAHYVGAPQQAGAGSMSLTVVGVDTLTGFARVMRYLQGLEIVTAVSVASVEPTQMTLNVSLRGDPAALARTIGLGNVLAAVSVQPAGNQTFLAGQYYRLMP